MLDNPTNLERVSIGNFSQTGGGLDGFTLRDRALLRNYRRRTA